MKAPSGVLIDLDGVVYNAEQPIPGSASAVACLRERGVPLLFVTNTTSRPRSALVQKLARFDVPAAAEEIWTRAMATRQWLASHSAGPVALFAPAALQEDFQGIDLLDEQAEVGAASVVVGDLGEGWSYRRLNQAFRLLHSNLDAKLIALGMTRYWKAADGVSLDVAPFVKALEYAAGRQAIVVGKPARDFYETAAARLKLAPKELVMIGDDIRTDVGGAQLAGLRGALVRTGKFREEDLSGEIRPDFVLDSLADVARLF